MQSKQPAGKNVNENEFPPFTLLHKGVFNLHLLFQDEEYPHFLTDTVSVLRVRSNDH